ncbi:MAG: hypothetical protein ACRDQW_10310 [Haloechinothrix sp.]
MMPRVALGVVPRGYVADGSAGGPTVAGGTVGVVQLGTALDDGSVVGCSRAAPDRSQGDDPGNGDHDTTSDDTVLHQRRDRLESGRIG